MGSLTRHRLGALFLTAALLGAAVPSLAGGEVVQQGTLRVSFHGGIAPIRLPRSEPVSVNVQLGGKIATTDRSAPPKLERIVLEINSNGKVNTAGVPTCSLAKLEAVSAATAAKSCASSLVGHGNVTSRVSLPGQGAFASNGSLEAFNGSYKGAPAIFAQVSSGAPLPLTYVIVFEIKKGTGTFGTSLVGTLPEIASEYGYISSFDLSLSRTFTAHGKKVGYASADCPAPSGFNAATFSFARASFEFEGGQSLSSKLVRECKVRK